MHVRTVRIVFLSLFTSSADCGFVSVDSFLLGIFDLFLLLGLLASSFTMAAVSERLGLEEAELSSEFAFLPLPGFFSFSSCSSSQLSYWLPVELADSLARLRRGRL